MNTELNVKQLSKRAAVILLAVLLAGCNKDDGYKLVFSHNLHVAENDVTCLDCHGKMADGHFAKPGHAVCKECHSSWIETKEITAETCGMCHKGKDLQEFSKTEPVPAAAGQVNGVFIHTEALANRCADCHGTLMDKKLKQVPELTHKEKVRIRDQAHHWGLSCTACHSDMDPKTPPPSHSQNWTRRHGTMGSQPDNACGVCHSKESCRDCHQVTLPSSHNNLWRLKTHGIQAAWDRGRCLVCHEQDSCTTCHESTRPQSHTAGWDKNHCNNCHPSKSTGTGCTLCHGDALESHPNPHSAGWLGKHCNNCHAGSPESRQCGVCHGWTDLGSHPNPHSVGWLGEHCNNCHAGTPESRQCGDCHGWSDMGSHPNPHSAGWRDRHCSSCHVDSPSQNNCATCHEGGNSVQVHESIWPPFHVKVGSRCSYCHEP